jgi:hypothetical protein
MSNSKLAPASSSVCLADPITTVRDTTRNLVEDQLGALGCWFDVHFSAV